MVIGLVIGIAAAAIVALAIRATGRGGAAELANARADADAEVAAAKHAAVAERLKVENAARAELADVRTAAIDEVADRNRVLDKREDAITASARTLAADQAELDVRFDAVDEIHRETQSRRDRATGLERDIARRNADAVAALEQRAQIAARDLGARLGREWIDATRAAAAAKIRAVDATAADPAIDREARRMLEISSNRYRHHFLTERSISNLRVGNAVVESLLADGGVLHAAIQSVANVQLIVADDRDAVRLDGLDGVGKEVARRAL